MKIRLSSILSLVMAAGAGLVLFQTSQNVQDSERGLHNIQTALKKEQDAMRVLETEWDYLNRPDRLEELARQHLKMAPQSPASLVRDSSELPESGAPAVPQRKPDRQIRPAVAVMEDAPVSATVESLQAEPPGLPMPAPVTNSVSGSDIRQQFDALLNDLTAQEPSAGGER